METDLAPLKIKRRFLIKWSLIAFSLVGIYFLAFVYLIDKRPFVEWTLIKSSPEEERAQAQLIKMPDGKIFLINAGDASGSLLLFLKKQKIKDIDVIVLSSNTPLTLSGLKEIVSAGIRVKEIISNPLVAPSSNWNSIQSLLQTKSVSQRILKLEDTLFESGTTQLKLVSLAKNSIALKLTHGLNKVLLILAEPSSTKSPTLTLGCEFFPVDILLDYSQGISEPKAWKSCSPVSTQLGNQKGTFKILLKGDSYKWKKGR